MTDRLHCAEAEGLAALHFGVSGKATELGGERTQNFRIRTGDGRTFTLKVSDPQEGVDSVLLENAALLHVERRAPGIIAPRVVPALDGSDLIPPGPQDRRYLRLLTYVPGTPLASACNSSAELRRNIGQGVAALDEALRDFVHPHATGRDLIWDVKNIGQIKPFLPLIAAGRRPLAEAMLERFGRIAGPHLPQLPAQVVHSDMNGQNILVDPDNAARLAGFLDFGDIVHAPRIVDLAGAALLQLDFPGDAPQMVAEVAVAYHGIAPLDEREINLLPEFMIARCVINVAVTEWLAAHDPENRAYIMKNNPASWARLEKLSALPREAFRQAFATQYESCLP